MILPNIIHSMPYIERGQLNQQLWKSLPRYAKASIFWSEVAEGGGENKYIHIYLPLLLLCVHIIIIIGDIYAEQSREMKIVKVRECGTKWEGIVAENECKDVKTKIKECRKECMWRV